jgi:tetratricopeptide (TPR) repeat protein
VAFPARARLAIAAPAALSGLVLAFTVHRLEAFDVWYHLAAGRLMVATGSWPTTNTFAFTAPDYPWTDLHWLFQLMLYAAWTVGGVAGCTLLAAAFTGATTTILYRAARRWLAPAGAAALLAVALTIASPRLVVRPEMVSFLLLAVYLWVLDRYPDTGRAVWLLVPLQVLWANTHGIFPLGLVVIGGYWAGATAAFLPVPRGWREATALSLPAWRRLSVVLVIATLGCLANPWGLRGATFPLELLTSVTGGSIFSARIGELRGPLEAGYALGLDYLWLLLLAGTALAFAVNVRRWHLGRLLVTSAFALLSTQALRNVTLFAWVAVPMLAANLGALRAARGRAARARVAGIAEGAAVAAIVLLAVAVATNHFSRWVDSRRELGLGVAAVRFPVDAVSFIEHVGIDGRPFNCLPMGGYLAWRRYPEAQVFVDGRLETYPEAVFRFYFRALDDPKFWPRLVARVHPDYAILYHAWPNRLPLVTYLASGHGWTLVYYDENAVIFLPEDEAHRAVRERAESAFRQILAERARAESPAPLSLLARFLRYPIADVWRQHRYGEFLRTMGFYDEAAAAYRRALALDPDLTETRFLLGLAYWYGGSRSRALVEWREVTRRDPTFAPARRALEQAAAGPRRGGQAGGAAGATTAADEDP